MKSFVDNHTPKKSEDIPQENVSLLKDFGIEAGEVKPKDIYQNKNGQINRKWSFSIHYKRNLKI